MRPRPVCYYVSGHGLGHASRACQVMRALPPDVPLIVKTTAPEEFIRREAGRPLEYISRRFDTGPWQASNTEIDWDRTFAEALQVHAACQELLPEEVAFLREKEVGVVVSDAPSPPLQAAAEAGIPGIAVLNFTWVEIFADFAGKRDDVARLISAYREQYASASLALRAALSFPMSYFPRIRDIPLIARTGSPCREQLTEALGIGSGERIVLLYFGAWGNSAMDIEKLATIRGVSFLAFTDMPAPVQVLDPGKWDFPDVVASVDAVLAKPGYGTVGECMANGTPVVYYPREEFAEYPILERSMEEWGGAVRISRSEFLSCAWQPALEQAFTLNPARVPSGGAAAAVGEILAALGR